MTGKRRIGIAICSLFLLSVFWTTLAGAQVQDEKWSAPYRLSSEEGAFLESSNGVVADQYGYVHVFWIEEGFPDDRLIIQYARFNGETWSDPIDIHTTRPGGTLDLLSPAVDQHGTLYLIWTEGGAHRQRPVYLISAPAHDALSVQQWSSPILIDVPAHLIRLQVDSKDVLHILYSEVNEPQPGVYYLRSADQGGTWSDPVWLDPDILPNHAPASLKFAIDEVDGLHAVWYYHSVDAAGGDWVRYAHSLDGGNNWSIPFTVDKDDEGNGRLRLADPIMAVQGQTVHIVWGPDTEGLIRREHRFSTDAGQTWSIPVLVFGNLNGQAGDDLTIDEAGNVHFLGQIRYPQGIYYAHWTQGQWVGPSLIYMIASNPFEPIGDRLHAHSIVSAIRAGNQLVTTFYDRSDERPFALYAMHRVLDNVPPVRGKSTPAPVLTSTPTLQPSPIQTSSAPLPTPTAPQFDSSEVPPLTNVPRPDRSFWLAIIPILVLVCGIVAFQLIKIR